jgi:hypothetical protein
VPYFNEDRNRARWPNACVASFAVTTGASAQSSALPAGRYLLTCDTDVFFQTGSNPTAVSTAGSESNPVWGRTYVELEIATANDKVAAIAKTAAGRVYILKPEA